MTIRPVCFAFLLFGVAACAAQNDMATPYASGGGTEGAAGDAFCASPPSDMSKMDEWNQMCMPGKN